MKYKSALPDSSDKGAYALYHLALISRSISYNIKAPVSSETGASRPRYHPALYLWLIRNGDLRLDLLPSAKKLTSDGSQIFRTGFHQTPAL